MISKIWKDGIISEIEIELAEPIEEDEPITFENKRELDEYMANFITEFLTEGVTNG